MALAVAAATATPVHGEVPWHVDRALGAVAPAELAGPRLVGMVHEVCAAATDRRRRGAWYTPPHVVSGLVELIWASGGPATGVFDPCAGGGAMLLAVADRLVADGTDPAVAIRSVAGTDVDAGAASVAEAGRWWWAAEHGVDPGPVTVHRADALSSDGPVAADLVLGNPPFGSPLRREVAERGAVTAIRDRHPGVLGPYADIAAAHVLAASERLGAGGRLCLVMPQSLFTGRDTEGLRARLADTTTLEAVWISAEPVFDAGARVGAVVVRRRPGPDVDGDTRPIRIRPHLAAGPSVEALGATAEAPTSWAAAATAALGAPALRWTPDSRTVGDLARCTAGFRDEFYAIAAATRVGEPDDTRPTVATVGCVDPLRLDTDGPVRLRRVDVTRPVLDADALDPATRRWWEQLAVPKVIVATQSRVLEPVVDRDGSVVPVTPLISVVPDDPADGNRIAAVLLAPPVVRWMWERRLGAALTTQGIAARAADLAEVPLPSDRAAWSFAVDAVEAGDVLRAASHMIDAYDADPDLLGWWIDRLGRNSDEGDG